MALRYMPMKASFQLSPKNQGIFDISRIHLCYEPALKWWPQNYRVKRPDNLVDKLQAPPRVKMAKSHNSLAPYPNPSTVAPSTFWLTKNWFGHFPNCRQPVKLLAVSLGTFLFTTDWFPTKEVKGLQQFIICERISEARPPFLGSPDLDS